MSPGVIAARAGQAWPAAARPTAPPAAARRQPPVAACAAPRRSPQKPGRQQTAQPTHAQRQLRLEQQQQWQRHGFAPHAAAVEEAVEEAVASSVDIESLVYSSGRYAVEGSLLTPAHADVVFEVLTDYDALPRVFHNVTASEVKRCAASGRKQLVQTCRWAFLVFSGTFVNELNVVEEPERRHLTFSLVQSAFMREFVGSWDVRPLPGGGAEVRHRMSVTPTVSPPQRVGDVSKRIFKKQVLSILGDLNAELESRLAAEQQRGR